MLKQRVLEPSRVQVAKISGVALDGGTVADIFAVSGGPIQLIALIGECMEAVSAHACNAKLIMDPTVGVDTDLCAVLDIVSLGLGSFLHITGTIVGALVKSVPGTGLPKGCGQASPLILPVGTIDLSLANNTPTSGIADFYLAYRPMSVDSIVVGG